MEQINPKQYLFEQARAPEQPQASSTVSPQTHPSTHKEDYLSIMNETIKQIKRQVLIDKLKQYNIYHQISGPQDQQVEIIKATPSQNFEVIELDVRVRCFRLKIRVLNHQRTSPVHGGVSIGQGAFGKIYWYEGIDHVKKAVKCIPLTSQRRLQEQILFTILQLSLLKIAAVVGSGPAINFETFDLNIYRNQKCKPNDECNDCIEFEMELCTSNFDFNQNQITQSLYALHQINMVHCDVKPENILYSQIQKKWVFVDFGLGSVLKEPLGEMTHTKVRGTMAYFSQEMQMIYLKQKGYVDLYWNDLFGLKKSIQNMKSQVDQQLLRKFKAQVAKKPEVKNQQQLRAHFLMLKLKYCVYFNNIKQIQVWIAAIKWTEQAKLQIFLFLFELKYLSTTVNTIFLQLCKSKEINQIKKLSLITSQLEFKSKRQYQLQQFNQKYKYFKVIFNAIQNAINQKGINQHLARQLSKKERKSINEMLKNTKKIATLRKEVYMLLLFKAVNFLQNKYHFDIYQKQDFCNIFLQFEGQKPLMGLASICKFITIALQACLQDHTHPLHLKMTQIYSNALMLGQCGTQKIMQVYSDILSTQQSQMNTFVKFVQIYKCNFWIERMLFMKYEIDYLKIKKHSFSILTKIYKLLSPQKNKDHCNCHPNAVCNQMEIYMLRKIQAEVNRQYFIESQERQTFQCKINKSLQIFHSMRSLIRQDEIQPNQSSLKSQSVKNSQLSGQSSMMSFFQPNNTISIQRRTKRYCSELPINMGDLFIKEYRLLNSKSYASIVQLLQQLINGSSITDNWEITNYKNMIRIFSFHVSQLDWGEAYFSKLQGKLNKAEYLQKSYFIFVFFYNIMQEIGQFQQKFHIYFNQMKELVIKHSKRLFIKYGNRFSNQQLLQLMIQLNYKQAKSIWKYLQLIIPTQKERVAHILNIFKNAIHIIDCLVKKQYKTMQLMIFCDISEMFTCAQIAKNSRTIILNCVERGDIVDMKLHYFQAINIRCNGTEKGQFYLNQFYKLVNNNKLYDDFIIKNCHFSVYLNLIEYLLTQIQFNQAIELISNINRNIFGFICRQTFSSFLKIRQKISYFFLNTIVGMQNWSKFINLIINEGRSMNNNTVFFFDCISTTLVSIQIIFRNLKNTYNFKPLSLNCMIKLMFNSMNIIEHYPSMAYYSQLHYHYTNLKNLYRMYSIVPKNIRFIRMLNSKHRKVIYMPDKQCWSTSKINNFIKISKYPIIIKIARMDRCNSSLMPQTAIAAFKRKVLKSFEEESNQVVFKFI